MITKSTHGCDFLCFDISNLLHRTFYAAKYEDDTTLAGMAAHVALTTLNKYFKIYKPKRVVMAFDRSSWRKDYTAARDYLKPYKGNRRQNMTAAQELKYKQFIAHLAEFEELITQHTTIITLAQDKLEADDLIAGFVQAHPENSIVIISQDSDYAQLLKHENVRLISPADGKDHSLEEYDNNPEYYLFHKCFRGDSTDNIQPAYPRIQSKKIKQAFDDSFFQVNLMKETWTDQNKVTHIVEDRFKDNQVLINLEKQPKEIRELIENTITEEINVSKKFSYFHILKFIGKYNLVKVKEGIDNYLPLLSCK